jgi:hypothetical protein
MNTMSGVMKDIVMPVNAVPKDSCDFKFVDAVEHAGRSADSSGLPQTVFTSASSGGWWHTNTFAACLQRAQMTVTVLPVRYFS